MGKHGSDRITFRMSKFKTISEDKSKLNAFLQGKGQMRNGVAGSFQAESTKHKSTAGQEMD